MWDEQAETFLASYSGVTRARYGAALVAFQVWYGQSYSEEPDARLLTNEEVRDYRAYLTSVKGYQAATVNLYLAPLRAIVRSLGHNLKVPGVAQVRPAVAALDGRGLGRLLAALEGPDWQDLRNVALVNVLARAGLRISEALALELADVDLRPRSGDLLVRQGKGSKQRTVPLAVEARQALTAYLAVRPAATTPAVFISRTWRRLEPRAVQLLLAEAAERGRVGQRVTPHLLRHTFATRFLERNGGDIATLARLLGHSNIQTTTRYLHPSRERLAEMVANL